MARLDARWDNFWERGQVWYDFNQDGPGQITYGSAFAVDATLLIVVPGSLTSDAIISALQSGSTSGDAVVRRTTEDSESLDAVVRGQVDASLTTDAVVLLEQTGYLPLDAVVSDGSGGSGSFTADAVLSGEFVSSGSFSADAIQQLVDVSGSFSASAIQRWVGVSGSFSADAFLSGRLDFYAIKHAVISGQLSAGAWKYVPRTTPNGPDEFWMSRALGQTPLVAIFVDDVDITEHVEFSTAEFTQNVNGTPGSFRMRVQDLGHNVSFLTGSEIHVDIDGKRRFGGYVLTASRSFYFPYDDTSSPTKTERYWNLEGTDYNILFSKRVVFDSDDPRRSQMKSWPVDTSDVEVIAYCFDNYTTLPEDRATHNSLTHVGTVNPEFAGVIGSGGWTFGDLMTSVNYHINGVFYFDQYKDLHFSDVDEVDAPKMLTDVPGTDDAAYRDFSFNRTCEAMVNDELVWGAAKGQDNLAFARTTDTDSIIAHGLWQQGEYITDMWAYVNRRADRVVNGSVQNKRGAKNDKEAWTLTTFDGSFTAGQKAQVENQAFAVSDVVPIRKITLTFPTPWDQQYDLILSHEIDAPWKWHESYFPKIKPRGKRPPPDPPKPDPPEPGECDCSITDTFNRPDGEAGVADCGLTWAGDGSIRSNQLDSNQGVAYLSFSLPIPFFCSFDIIVTGWDLNWISIGYLDENGDARWLMVWLNGWYPYTMTVMLATAPEGDWGGVEQAVEAGYAPASVSAAEIDVNGTGVYINIGGIVISKSWVDMGLSPAASVTSFSINAQDEV